MGGQKLVPVRATPGTHWPVWRRRLWIRVAVWWVAFAVLALSYHATGPTLVVERQAQTQELRSCMPHEDQLVRLVVHGREGASTIERRGAEWFLGERQVPRDLLAALFEAVGACPAWPVVAGSKAEWGKFGLDEPVASLELEARGPQARVRLFFGSANASGTGRYVRMNDDPRVYLAGVQAWYYTELLAGRALDNGG